MNQADKILAKKVLQLRCSTERLKSSVIAAELKVPEYKISRVIDAAWREGFAKVQFDEVNSVSEEDFTKRFGLKWVRFVEARDDYSVQKTELGKAAAEEFEKLVRAGPKTIALGGGDSLHQMVLALKRRSRAVTLAPLALICRSIYGDSFDGAFVTMEAASISLPPHCRARVCALPPLPPGNIEAATEFTKRLFDENAEVREVFLEALNAEAMFVGVSNYGSEPEIVESHERVGIKKTRISQMKAVGHLNFSFFDAAGQDVTSTLATEAGVLSNQTTGYQGSQIQSGDRHPFLAALSLSAIKGAANDAERPERLVILVAAGEHKRTAIRTVLERGIVNAAVIDRQNAEEIFCSTAG